MRKYLRVAAGLSCLGVLILGAVALDPTGPLLSAFQGCAAQRATMREVFEQAEQLDEDTEAFHRRWQAKRQVAAEVLAGRCSLAEALEQFRALDQEGPPFLPSQMATERLGISEDEWRGQRLLYFVQLVLADRPDEAAVVVRRLEKELQQLLADQKKRPPAPAEDSR